MRLWSASVSLLITYLFSAFAHAGEATAVPTLDNWGMVGLSAVVGLAGIIAIRRMRK